MTRTRQSKIRLLVNAIPLTNVHTGIGRYLRCLYEQMEACHGHDLDIGYFDGKTVFPTMPTGPENQRVWSGMARLFWQLPAHIALAIRLTVQARREAAFKKAARDFDLYHEAGFFPFAPIQGLKTVFTLHDCSIFRHPEFHPNERVLFTKQFLPKRIHSVEHILCVSAFTQKEANELLHVPYDRMTVTHLASDRRFTETADPEECSWIRKKYHLPEHYYLFVGGGDPRKNLHPLLSALEQISGDIPLVVVGWSGWDKGEKWDNVIRIGHIDDHELALLYRTSQALLYPSQYEGFGLPILEAMTLECPVITMKNASIPEVAGSAALYLHSITQPDLATALRLLDSPDTRKALIDSGRDQAKQFSWKGTAETTFRVFQNVMAR